MLDLPLYARNVLLGASLLGIAGGVLGCFALLRRQSLVGDALARQESCGGHFNERFQTDENEALRDDENFCHVAAWEYRGKDNAPRFCKEPLAFENVELSQRSYK